ncbi:MAG: hypothetical protein JWR52_3905 [Marmoricola sp.]|nr:hypothetical protein [Marmoricola sp.]
MTEELRRRRPPSERHHNLQPFPPFFSDKCEFRLVEYNLEQRRRFNHGVAHDIARPAAITRDIHRLNRLRTDAV